MKNHTLEVARIAALCAVTLCACGPTGADAELAERPASAALEEVEVDEPIAFTDVPYTSAIDGPSQIAELSAMVQRDEFVWHGFAPEASYPVSGDCDYAFSREQDPPATLTDLPMTVEGVVTLHPRYFLKTGVCGSDQRFYGSFFIEDSSGGILVLRDSRIAPFTFGDRVRLTVTGLTKFFDYEAVLTFTDLEILEQDERTPIAYQSIERPLEPSDSGQVRRIVGRVISEATNNNFNELQLESTATPGLTWFVSLDRELGQRNPNIAQGDVLEVTGPVINSFGLRVLLASYGQFENLSN